MITAAFGVTVSLRNRVPGGTRDGSGNVVSGFTAWADVSGCRLGTDASVEQDGSTADTIATSYRLRFPLGTQVGPRDQVRLPGSDDVWQVDGDPLLASSSFTAFNPGPLVTLTRATG